MSLDSLLASINSGVTQVTRVQASKHKGFSVTPNESAGVTRVTTDGGDTDSVTPVTPQETAGVTAKPKQDKGCTSVTPVTPENGIVETETKARELLTAIVRDIGEEPAEVLDWYRDDYDDIAELPRDQLVFMVRDYFANHRQYRPDLYAEKEVQCGACRHWKERRPHIGDCDKGHRHAIAGNWDTTWRVCGDYVRR